MNRAQIEALLQEVSEGRTAVAEAMERGFNRRQKEGLDISRMGPVCTIMGGRLDDWLKARIEAVRSLNA